MALLEIKQLTIRLKNEGKTLVQNLDFELNSTQILGIVGESGSGKTLSGLAIMNLLNKKQFDIEGQILFNGVDLVQSLKTEGNFKVPTDISMVFQESMSAFNPSLKMGFQLMESMESKLSKVDKKTRIIQLLEEVQIPNSEKLCNSYPHELSGGQLQRAMMVMALASKPKLIIADEPTTALDVLVQKEVTELLVDLCKKNDVALIFISHDLPLVAMITDFTLVMRNGELMEYNSSKELFKNPQNKYTKALIACKPKPGIAKKRLPTVDDFLNDTFIEKTEVKKESNQQNEILLQANDLKVTFSNKGGLFGKKTEFTALNNVSFELKKNETLGLVGGSGSGKSTVAKVICGLVKLSEGEIIYKDEALANKSLLNKKTIANSIRMVFQDPFNSLNPRLTVFETLIDEIKNSKNEAKNYLEVAEKLMLDVKLNASDLNKYPHQFSGGQRQRICIARAIASQPELLILDESVSALDISVQASVLNLLNDLKNEYKLTYLFISHDLSVVDYFSDRIIVLSNGEIVEEGLSGKLFQNAEHPYTQKLINSIPQFTE